jgi:DNA polymerase-3 subunit delta'
MRFQEIPGQAVLKQKLIQTVIDQRVSHAQLFFGPEGSRKLALAIAYAQFINCTSRVTAPLPPGGEGQGVGAVDACGICPSCIKYGKLIHPDLHFIYPVSTTKKVPRKPQSRDFIEDWRKFLIENQFNVTLQEWYESIEIENKQGIINAEDCNEIITTLGYKSYESEYKVMIIWMVEKLFYSAAPKILKILEEPPEKTLFLLISEDPDQIIKTILSRTLMVKIPPVPKENTGKDEDDLIYFEFFRQWMRNCFSGKVSELIGFASEISRYGREKQKGFLNYGLKVIALCAALNYRDQIDQGLYEEKTTFIRKFSPYINVHNLAEFNDLFNTAIYHIERNAHSSTLFLDLSFKIIPLFKPDFVPL